MTITIIQPVAIPIFSSPEMFQVLRLTSAIVAVDEYNQVIREREQNNYPFVSHWNNLECKVQVWMW